tara:strand:- start:1554 stop:1850 length:297 start_codon:yes stop_codon:yes gene_type:complete
MFENKLTKINIAKNLSVESGFSMNLSKKLINDLIDIIILNIKSGNFNLKNVGSFKLKLKKQRIGRNPKTKEKFIIPSRKSISFKCSKRISNYLENAYE